MTYDCDFRFQLPGEPGSWTIHMQKLKYKCQSVQKIEWKEIKWINGWTLLIALISWQWQSVLWNSIINGTVMNLRQAVATENCVDWSGQSVIRTCQTSELVTKCHTPNYIQCLQAADMHYRVMTAGARNGMLTTARLYNSTWQEIITKFNSKH